MAEVQGLQDDDESKVFATDFLELDHLAREEVFSSQWVKGAHSPRWAFTDPKLGFKGHDLESRVFLDQQSDLIFLVHRGTVPGNLRDYVNDGRKVVRLGIPEKYRQAAQLIELVKPEFQSRLVQVGHSLGGGMAAYAATHATWPVRTIAFDPLGLTRRMLRSHQEQPASGAIDHVGNSAAARNQPSENCNCGSEPQSRQSDCIFHSCDNLVDWYYVANSWVANLNSRAHLATLGTLWEMPQDAALRASGADSHDLRHIGYGLRERWQQDNLKTNNR
jgi:pimeloyl-ACP methyl ester carboxylesterase